MDIDRDRKHNQKCVRKDSLVLSEIVSGIERDCEGQGWIFY